VKFSTPREGSFTSRWRTRADVGHLSRVHWLADPRNARRAAVRGLPYGSRAAQGHRDDQPGRRRGRDQGAGAGRLPGPLRRGDPRASARAPALRPTRVRAVLGRRRGTRPAAEPAHHHATAGQDPRGRRKDIARRQQPRDKGVPSGAVDVRSDLLRRLRPSSRLRVAIVEFELAWTPHLLSTMDYTYRERHGEAIYRFKGLPSRRRGTACCRAISSAATWS
jgi:hypothetical protein